MPLSCGWMVERELGSAGSRSISSSIAAQPGYSRPGSAEGGRRPLPSNAA
jgi:hypothetical protein